MVHPALADLPVYVRAGAIVPMQPLVQSTSDTPDGPLTLRVFPPEPGGSCGGELYQDDGKSYDFRKGAFLRLHVSCETAADGALTVRLPRREGSFAPWWKAVRVEVVGAAKPAQAMVGSRSVPVEQTSLGWAVTFADKGEAQTILWR
jgi:alpha-glucosidase